MSNLCMPRLAGASALMLLFFAAPLAATTVDFSDRTLWEATTPGFSTIDFEDYDGAQNQYADYSTAAGLTINDFNFVGIYGATYFLYVVNGEWVSDNDFNSGAILKGPPYEAGASRYIEVTLPEGITSFGVDLMSVVTDAQFFSIELSTSDVFTGIQTGIQPARTFFGVNTDSDISFIRFVLTSGTANSTSLALDNFSYGAAVGGPGEVPEVATMFMVGTGLVLLFRLRRKQILEAMRL